MVKVSSVTFLKMYILQDCQPDMLDPPFSDQTSRGSGARSLCSEWSVQLRAYGRSYNVELTAIVIGFIPWAIDNVQIQNCRDVNKDWTCKDKDNDKD